MRADHDYSSIRDQETTTLPTGPRSTEIAEFREKLKAMAAARLSTHANTGRGRLIFALDATASRMPTWDLACRIQGEMFEAAAAHGGLEVQLVYYRGFDECKASPWVMSAPALHQMMSRVGCAGGETQIKRVLSHAIRETNTRRVGALVFVGDAMEEQLDRLCHLAGEIGSLGVPIFLFHESSSDPDAPQSLRAFQQLAGLSHGACLSFDLASPARLKALLGAVAVYATGGYPALEAYGRKQGGEVLRLTQQLKC
jgi:hypothetical protein